MRSESDMCLKEKIVAEEEDMVRDGLSEEVTFDLRPKG